MTANRSHLAGLELALDEMHDMLDGSCEARLTRLIAEAQSAPEPVQGEAVKLQHMAVVEDGVLRWMTGRKIDNCELYAMPDFGRAPPLYTAAAKPDAELVALKDLLPALDNALEDLELHGRHSDQGYRKLKDWYRKVALITDRIEAKLAELQK